MPPFRVAGNKMIAGKSRQSNFTAIFAVVSANGLAAADRICGANLFVGAAQGCQARCGARAEEST
jgi:hypothetical protein